mmetsp:Transcript_22824/g.65868  ORF Transcript_22824/g.65868 Transcript_22824/m.65868 type:complete len:229 (-) Transcript_22824:14-700(-)
MWQLPVEGPQGHADAVPAQVSEGTERLGGGVHSDVAAGPRRVVPERDGEGRRHVPHLPKVLRGNCSLHLDQARVMHEHRVIHELHTVVTAHSEGLDGVLVIRGDGLLAEDVLLRRGRLLDPLEPQGSGKGNIHGLHRLIREHGIVAAIWLRPFGVGIDEVGGLVQGPRTDGHHRGVLGMGNAMACLGGNLGATDDAPTDLRARHPCERSDHTTTGAGDASGCGPLAPT